MDFKSSSIPTPSDPKFMNKLSQIECEISKSLNNLYLNYLLWFSQKKLEQKINDFNIILISKCNKLLNNILK